MFFRIKSVFTTRVLMRASIIFLPLTILLLACLVGIRHLYEADYIEKVKFEGKRDLLKHKAECSHIIDHAIEDTLWLAEITEKYFSQDAVLSDIPGITQRFSSYGAFHPYYDQIRYIDQTGRECIRVNFDGNSAVVVPDHLLQDKHDRYYFKETAGLEEGHVYISPIDLNIENGQIEHPLKPMIRFSTPVYVSGRFCGIVILNFKAKVMLDTFEREKLAENEPTHNYLINENGYVLEGLEPQFLWGFMFEQKHDYTLSHFYPDAGSQILSVPIGYCKTSKGLFLWETIDPFDNMSVKNPALKRENVENLHPFKVVYHLSEKDYRTHMYVIDASLLTSGIILMTIFLAGSVALSYVSEQRQYSLKLLKTSEAQARELAMHAQIADQTKSEFLATISHELRTPLNAILGFSEVLDDGLNEDQQEYLTEIQIASNRLFKIVEGILDFSNIARGRFTPDFDECILDDILNKLRFRFHGEINNGEIEFTIHKNAQVPERLYTDEIRLFGCLENLLDNAVKFTENGHIYLNVALEENEANTSVRFDIEDTGVGISEKHQSQIVRAFTQADGSDSRAYGGVGMGLTLTRELVQQLNGRFSFSSRPGEGSVFTIHIPLAQADNPGEPETQRSVLVYHI